MVIDREQIINVLGTIIEPDLKKDIVSLNLVEDIQFSATSIDVIVNVSNPALHARKRMQEAVAFNLKRVFGKDISITCDVKGIPVEAQR